VIISNCDTHESLQPGALNPAIRPQTLEPSNFTVSRLGMH
jgi:hypothetical protein